MSWYYHSDNDKENNARVREIDRKCQNAGGPERLNSDDWWAWQNEHF